MQDDTSLSWRRPGVDQEDWRSAASITNLLGSSPEMEQVLYTPLTPIEEENACLGCLLPGRDRERDERSAGQRDRDSNMAHDEERAKGKPPGARQQQGVGGGLLSSLEWSGLVAWSSCRDLNPCASQDGTNASWEQAAEGRLRALGDACCSFSFCHMDVSRALPSWTLASFWDHECVP